jgi:hypothetical protein
MGSVVSSMGSAEAWPADAKARRLQLPWGETTTLSSGYWVVELC